VIRRIIGALLVASAIPAHAQLGQRRVGGGADPGYWVGLSYGYVSGTTVSDNATSTTWQFGYTSQLRATVEKTVQPGVTIGASAGFATAPLTYSTAIASAACAGSCQANANITQYMGFIRSGGGPGFHGLYALEAGATEFSKFRTRDGDAPLPPAGAKYDLSFGLGAGFGYGFSRATEMYVGQHWDLVLHRQSTVNGENGNAPRISTFRGGFRVGF
jgi:hypothetical protein